MEPDDENAIAKKVFEKLLAELNKGGTQFVLKNDYVDPCKIAIRFLNNKKRVVLIWRSNSKDRELTTRREYKKCFGSLSSEFKQERCPDYFSQILSDAGLLLKAMADIARIAEGIIKIANGLT